MHLNSCENTPNQGESITKATFHGVNGHLCLYEVDAVDKLSFHEPTDWRWTNQSFMGSDRCSDDYLQLRQILVLSMLPSKCLSDVPTVSETPFLGRDCSGFFKTDNLTPSHAHFHSY